jgi:hypothetical protein
MPKWQVDYHEEFQAEVEQFPEGVQDKIAAMALLLEAVGPQLSRPRADTLKGSKHTNMKELRFGVGKQAWRVAFAFDPQRRGILLVGGNKQGVNEKQFYEELIRYRRRAVRQTFRPASNEAVRR